MAVTLLVSCGEDRSALPTQGRLLAIGDSVLSFHGDDDAPILAALELGYAAANESAAGAWVAHPQGRSTAWPVDVRSQYDRAPSLRYDWVIVNGGSNDLSRSCACRACETTLEQLVGADGRSGHLPELADRIRADGAQIVFVGYFDVQPWSVTDATACNSIFNELDGRVRQMAEARDGVWFLDASDVITTDRIELYHPDGRHTSVRGSQLLGRELAELIAEIERS